jgi:hypothetical protein
LVVKKGSKTRFMVSSSMPQPVSATEMRVCMPGPRPGCIEQSRSSTFTALPPPSSRPLSASWPGRRWCRGSG